jgi:hypothetical protein
VSRSLANVLPFKPPMELVPFLDNPPLVGDETLQDYYNLAAAVVQASKPTDAIDWLNIMTVVDLTWEIRRERRIKASIVKSMQKEIVLDLLKTISMESPGLDSHIYRIFGAAGDVEGWVVDGRLKQEIEAKLAAAGYPESEVMARAYMRGASHIDAVERRVASYEARRTVVLREIERRNERLAQRLEKVSSDVIDAEFSEAAE